VQIVLLYKQQIEDAFELLARCASQKKECVHALIGGSASVVLQTQDVRINASDIDLAIRSVVEHKTFLSRDLYWDVCCELVGDAARAAPYKSVSELKVDPRIHKQTIFVQKHEGRLMKVVPYASYRDMCGNGMTISLVTLDEVFDGKINNIMYCLSQLEEGKYVSDIDKAKMCRHMHDVLALGVLLGRDVSGKKNGSRNLVGDINFYLTDQEIRLAQSRGAAGFRPIVYQHIGLH